MLQGCYRWLLGSTRWLLGSTRWLLGSLLVVARGVTGVLQVVAREYWLVVKEFIGGCYGVLQ
ncbi:hypothetical protein ANANG_G00194180, partial [Anguilla anguilla]